MLLFHPLRRLLVRAGFKPHVFRRCRSGHDYTRLYGDEILHREARYACENCPHKIDDPMKIRPMLDTVVDPLLGDVQALRKRYQGLS
jgi:hypothetical protein